MLGLFAALCSSSRACADTADRWRNLADQIFHPVARDLNLPNVLIPEVIAQDGQGFIWPGEETGMLRWDGYRLRSYTYDEAVPDGLQDDFPVPACRSPGGLATGGGLSHLGAAHQVLGLLRHQAARPGSLPDDVVSAMLRDHRATLARRPRVA